MIRIRVTRNEFAKIADQLPKKGHDAVATTALEMEDGAKRRSRIRTGTMMRGWRAVFDDPYHAIVGNPVPYAKYNEFGTAHMAAQPMIVPEAELARPKFERRVRDALQP